MDIEKSMLRILRSRERYGRMVESQPELGCIREGYTVCITESVAFQSEILENVYTFPIFSQSTGYLAGIKRLSNCWFFEIEEFSQGNDFAIFLFFYFFYPLRCTSVYYIQYFFIWLERCRWLVICQLLILSFLAADCMPRLSSFSTSLCQLSF